MQMLSYVPQDHNKLRAGNDYGISIVQKYTTRFGLLAALPTDDAEACLDEINRTAAFVPAADGFAVSTVYRGIRLSDPLLEPVWQELNTRHATVFVHPDARAGPSLGRPSPLIEVAFDTTRTVVDVLYRGVFLRYPDIKFVIAHCGGALPALSGRLALLGAESWVPNPNNITSEEIEEQLGGLYVDTAANARTGLAPAITMVGKERCVYGADCGVPCSTERTMEQNRMAVLEIERELGIEGEVGMNGWTLFPSAAKRIEIVK
jgi:predicted TIM-barrel fold metal-dependent hydrolase